MIELFEDEHGAPLFSADIDKLRKEQDEKRKADLVRWSHDFKDALTATPAGRRVLWWLMNECYVFRKFNQYSAAAYAFEGKREIGQDILTVIGADEVLRSLILVKNENLRREFQEENHAK